MMTAAPTRLIVVRHGNTFQPDEKARRVGGRTDLPLVQSGHEQAQSIGNYLLKNNMLPDIVYTSSLKRTIETAAIALDTANHDCPRHILPLLQEIDYGPDENQPEDAVIARIGRDAVKQWDEQGIVPDGWMADPAAIKQGWRDFAASIAAKPGLTVMAVTSNGIARFAPFITKNPHVNSFKVSTGSISLLIYNDEWNIDFWNLRPAAA